MSLSLSEVSLHLKAGFLNSVQDKTVLTLLVTLFCPRQSHANSPYTHLVLGNNRYVIPPSSGRTVHPRQLLFCHLCAKAAGHILALPLAFSTGVKCQDINQAHRVFLKLPPTHCPKESWNLQQTLPLPVNPIFSPTPDTFRFYNV